MRFAILLGLLAGTILAREPNLPRKHLKDRSPQRIRWPAILARKRPVQNYTSVNARNATAGRRKGSEKRRR